MFRKLSLALAVSAALSSAGALALGLGEISTNSALNENFDADIELVSVEQGEIEVIKANLAPAADFARKGLDRPFLLSKLRFRPMVLDDGRSVIRITTEEAVREPFLNFLVEVNWPKGRLIREFTVLLDPPVTLKREPPPITPVVTAPATAVEMAAPLVERYAPPVEERRYTPAPAAAVPPETTAEAYGPVPRGMTLWRIAREMEVAGASMDQVMMALFRSNPAAFIGNDINKLRAGAMLRLPAREAIFSRSPQRARAEFRSPTRRREEPQAVESDRMQIATVPAEGVAGTDIERVKTDLMLVRETGESTRQETEELRSRIHELEAQLADIRQLLKLKSEQLAALHTVPAGPIEETVAVAPEPEVEAPAEVVEEPEPLPPEEAVVQEPDEPVVEAPVETKPAAVVETALPVEPEPQPAQPPAKAVPPARVEAPPAKPAPEPGWAERLLSDTTVLGIAAAVAVVLLSLGWLLIRRRREAEGRFDESALPAAPSESKTVELEKGPGGAEPPDRGEETSFISDFSPSDIDALQEETGEVDPAAEADVYIAYGRYQQAENLISQAIEKAPDRLDLKLKLLEIYFTTRNPASYIDVAAQLESAGAPEKDPQLWARVQSMGRELVPGHQLFGAPEPGAEAPEAAMGGGEGETRVTDTEASAGPDLDLDLDLDTELSELQKGPPPGGAGFDAGAVPEPPPVAHPEGTAAEGAERAGVDDEEDDTEFAIDLSDLETLEDIDLGDLGISSEEPGVGQPDRPATAEPAGTAERNEEEPVIATIAEPAAVPEESEFELSQFDLEEPATSKLEAGEPVSEKPEGAEGRAQDSETKLDLARVYIEMGDTEGASEFLEEVLQEGSDEQKSAAKALLENITG